MNTSPSLPSSKKAEPDPVLPPGARVVIRDEEWVVRAAHHDAVGGQVVEVVGLSALVRNQTAVFLSRLDPVTRLEPASTALVEDPTPGFRRSRLYLESLLRRTPPTDARIHVGHRGAADPLPYQLEPAAKALALPRARILIADDVGLGKTIEVGVLLAELIRRGQGRRILVVTLKSLLGQFQRELWHRFTIPLSALDSVGIERMRAKVPATTNPFHVHDRVIVSVDTLKKDTRYRRFLERARWDVVVIDECQNVAARATGARRAQRARLAELLADTCDALILTSATPHDGRPESFASLVNLLDPTAIHDPKEYTPDDVRALYVRRFKKDVADQVQKRFRERLPPRLEAVPASPAEDALLRALHAARFPTLDGDARGGQPLFRTVLLKAFLSSPTACRKTLEARQGTLAKRGDEAAVADRARLAELAATVATVESDPAWPKFETLVAWLREAGWKGKGAVGERVVIFSERVDTLEVLETKLNERLGLGDKTVARFYGALRDTEQDELVRDFGVENGKTRILLASDAASEGINLHFFCHRMVHFDIPWSLITLEQRNGRIDRFGQSQRPDIRYLLVQPGDPALRGDLRVLHRLVEREDWVHKNLGDAGWLMRCYDPVTESLRVAEVIEEKRTVEEILPDAVSNPGDDILAMLLAEPAAAPEARVDPTAPTLSLYPEDLAFAQEAFAEIEESDPTRRPKFLDHLPGFTLDPPEDLARRYASIPRAFRSAKRAMQLTTDRARVTGAIEKARSQKGATPEWELFWPLHPVADWLCDRVLARFERHEAPVVEVPRGVAADEVAYVYQGIYANLRAEPRIVAWFAVIRSDKGHRIEDFEHLVRETGLDKPLTNTRAARNFPWIQLHLAATIPVAEQHLRELREGREKSLTPELRREWLRVSHWRDAMLDAIDHEEGALERAPRADEARRFAERRADVERICAARQTWLDEGLRTVPVAVLRLAAVLVSKESRA